MNSKIRLLFLIFILSVLVIINLQIGSFNISIKDFFHFLIHSNEINTTKKLIITHRIQHVCIAILSCGAISIAGLCLQTLFRNYLAGPSVLGISTGGILGMALGMLLFENLLSFSSIKYYSNILFSVFGCMIVLSLLLIINKRLKSAQTLLLIGLMISFTSSALVDLVKVYFTQNQLQWFTIWSMSSFSNGGSLEIIVLLVLVIISYTLLTKLSKALDIYEMGDELATSMGVNLTYIRAIVLFITALLIATTTAICGPIAFIGLVVPQIVKLFSFGTSHKQFLPYVLLLGASAGILSDILSKIIYYPQILPVNSINSLLGIPVLIWILLKNKEIA